jgi:hypothetical protein
MRKFYTRYGHHLLLAIWTIVGVLGFSAAAAANPSASLALTVLALLWVLLGIARYIFHPPSPQHDAHRSDRAAS